MALLPKIATILVVFVLVKIVNVNCSVLDEETLNLISQLREKIQDKASRLSPVHKYVMDDIYILQWLKANAFDLEDAKADFMDHLFWRRQHNVDAVLQEDWTSFAKNFPAFTDTMDELRRPIAEVWIANWDIRGAVINGLAPKIIRWHIYLNEMQQKRLFEKRQEDKSVTGAVEIYDFNGFSILQQGGPSCLAVLMQMYQIWSKHYSGIMEDVYLVNVKPHMFGMLKISGQYFYTPAAPDALKAFRTRGEWLPVIDRAIDRDQRSERFGGTIKRDFK